MLLPWLSWCLFFLFSLLLLFLSVLCIQPLNEWSDAIDLKTQPPTHTSLLSPCVSGHLYLDICYIPQAEHVNWTHYLPFLLLPTPHSPSPIFFCVTTPILDRKTHHPYTFISISTYMQSVTKSYPLIFLPFVLSIAPLLPSLSRPPPSSTWTPAVSSQLLFRWPLFTHDVLHATTRIILLKPQHPCFHPFRSLPCNPCNLSLTGSSCITKLYISASPTWKVLKISPTHTFTMSICIFNKRKEKSMWTT